MTFDGELVVCRNVESAILDFPLEHVWAFMKTLDFAKLFPHSVASCHLLVDASASAAPAVAAGVGDVLLKHTIAPSSDPAGLPTAVGSLRQVQYKDGAVFIFRLVEISDLRHQLAFELIHANPSIQVSGILHSLKLMEITETSQTLLVWDSEFSGDSNYNFVHDQKWKKLDAFGALRVALGSQ
jgi:hypothetical protein